MKMLKPIAVWTGVVVGILAIAAIAFTIGRWTAPTTTAQAERTEAATDMDRAPSREQIYTCPMHPQVRTTDPNERCPICAMELVPLDEDDDEPDEGELPRLRVSDRAAALMNVQTVPARRTAAQREVRLYGRIDYDERRLKTITAWTSGRLDELFIDFTGQRIERDEPMAKLYSPELIAAQEELLSAIEARERFRDRNGSGAGAGVEAARERLRLLGVHPVFIDEIETTREVHDHVMIHAPMGGTVTRRYIREGEYVNTGDSLFAIADLSHLWVHLNVFESDFVWLQEGQPVEFTTQSVPGRTFEGTVSFIDPVLDDRTRSVRVRIDLPNDDGRLKPGMFVRGTVRAKVDAEGSATAVHVHDKPLVIPASAPLITGRRAVVYVKLRDTERPTFEARDVLLGPRVGEKFLVFEGIEEGELVVVNGQFRIDSELQIRGRPSMMQPAEEEPEPEPLVDEDHPALAIHPEDVPDAFAAQLADLLEDYLALMDALSQDDFDSAVSFAHAMHEQLYDTDPDLLESDVRDAWGRLDQDLHHVLHEMLDADDIDALRVTLEPLTEFTAVMVAHFIGDRAGTIYRAHCPMVDDFRGADWLQRETAITNPYFGSQMFRCGEIVGDVQQERHQTIDVPRDQEDVEPADDDHAETDFPDAFQDIARAVLDHFDEIVNAIEHEHESHARQAVRQMQDALLAVEFDALDEATMQAWLRADIEIMDALRAMLEADSFDVMREHLTHLERSVERANALIDSGEGGDA